MALTLFHRTTVGAVRGIPYGDWEDWEIEFEYLDAVEGRCKTKLGLVLCEVPFSEPDMVELGLLNPGEGPVLVEIKLINVTESDLEPYRIAKGSRFLIVPSPVFAEHVDTVRICAANSSLPQ